MTSRCPRVSESRESGRFGAVYAESTVIMDLDDSVTDPFSSEGLWRLSKFTTLSLQPLESLPWNDNLPGESHGMVIQLIDI